MQTSRIEPTAASAAPVVDVTFAEAHDVSAVLFLPGSERALVHLRADAIDVWAAAVHWWPEALGAVVGVVSLFCLLRIAQVARRPQRRGEPHCRRCNYNLSGHADRLGAAASAVEDTAADRVRCPECGVELASRPPRTGRRTWRRLALPVALIVLVAGSYSGMHAAGVRRQSAMSGWLSLPSLRAEQLRQERGWTWLDPYHSRRDLLLEIDVGSGEVIRRVALRASATWFQPALSPDGALAALSGGPGRIDLVDVASGRRRARFEFGPDVYGEHHRTVVFSPDGQWLYVAFADEGRDRLVRWDWRTGQREQLTDFPVFQWDRQGTATPSVRRYALLHRPEGMRILAAPSFMEAYETKVYDLRIFDGSGAELARHVLDASPIGAPAVTPDGARAFTAGSMRLGIHGLDLETGESLGVLSYGIRRSVWDKLAISRDGRLLAIPTTDETILVRDLEQKRWLAELRHDANLIAPDVWFSPDGRWLAANPFDRSTGGGRGYTHHLLVFDLAAIEREPDGR